MINSVAAHYVSAFYIFMKIKRDFSLLFIKR